MKKLILIVDDDRMFCFMLARRLSFEGYTCLTANTGREALRFVEETDLSLIISDIRMPEMSGLELFREIRQLRPNLPVIVITGNTEMDIAAEAMRLGTYEVIIKPFEMDQVLLTVKRSLEKSTLEEEISSRQQNLEKPLQGSAIGD